MNECKGGVGPMMIAIAAATLILFGLQSAAERSRPAGGAMTMPSSALQDTASGNQMSAR